MFTVQAVNQSEDSNLEAVSQSEDSNAGSQVIVRQQWVGSQPIRSSQLFMLSTNHMNHMLGNNNTQAAFAI